ncbi:hypothetical protein K435DRAFT_812636, partial [Dendrothele bispora CBS 962.96]
MRECQWKIVQCSVLGKVVIIQPGVIVCSSWSKRQRKKQKSGKVGKLGTEKTLEWFEIGGFGVEEDERMRILRDEGEKVGGMDDGEDRKSNDGKGDGGDGGEEKQER